MMVAMTTMTTMTTEAMTEPGRPARRAGVSVRVRITATVAALVTIALAGAGLIVYVVEVERVEASVQREVEQELDEFVLLRDEGVNPRTGEPFEVESLLRTFLLRNVPDDDELLIGWVGDKRLLSPRDALAEDPSFLDAIAPLVTEGGTDYLDTDYGEVRVTSQPVQDQDGANAGALLVVAYLDEDRGELVDTMQTYSIVALLSLFIITWVAWWQAGRLLGPLRTLRHTADDISATDLSRRIPETGNDDITALTRTVNTMLDRLEAAFVGQRQFLDDAGHELRTPLTVLRGHLELLDSGSPEEVEETRALLLDEVDRMARLVGDLILLAKTGRPDFLAPRETDLGELAASVVAKARGLGDRRWVLETPYDEDLDRVVLDEQRLTQALLQLADNAVKHTDAGQEIGVGITLTDGRVRCWVRDTGEGVPPEDRERIFRRFGRGPVRPGDEGFGLGLSIVAAIAEAHGGRAYADDPPPDRPPGARFVIDLPAVRPLEETTTWPAS